MQFVESFELVVEARLAARSMPASISAMSRLPHATPIPARTMRYDRARKKLDRHPNYILAASMASGTSTGVPVVPMSEYGQDVPSSRAPM